MAAPGLINACLVDPSSTTFALSLLVTASGALIASDDARRASLECDAEIVPYLAKAPGSRLRQIGNDLDIRDRQVLISLNRLEKDGLVVLQAEGEPVPLRSDRLSA